MSTFTAGLSALFLGLIIALLLTVAAFFLVRAWNGKARDFSVLSYIIGVVLFILLTFQMSALIGAIKVKGMCSELSVTINDLAQQYRATTDSLNLNREEINDILTKTVRQLPIVNSVVSDDDIQASSAGDIGEAVTHKLQVACNWYIVRRLGWSLLFIILSLIGISKTMGGGTTMKKRPPSTSYVTDDF